MAEGVVTSVRGYRDIALMWTRAAMAYPASFWMMAVSGFAVGILDFVGIWIMFHTIDSLGGWSLSEIAFLYGATGFGLAAADLVVGRIERLGQRQGWSLVGGLALQAGWAAVLLGVCWLVLRQATRKVVVQGG